MDKEITAFLISINNILEKIPKSIILKPMLDYRESKEEEIEKLVNTDILKAVWEVCDGSLNVTKIGEKLGKNKGTISAQIKPWIEAKIVFEIKRDNSKYPITIDEIINSLIVSCID